MARKLARFMPDWNAANLRLPYPIDDPDDTYVIDEGNDWFTYMNPDDNQLVEIRFRHAAQRPEVESAFVNWVLAKNHGWEIADNQLPAACTVINDVAFTVEFPMTLSALDLHDVTFEIPLDGIVVFLSGRPVPGARVVEYSTHEMAEFLLGGDEP